MYRKDLFEQYGLSEPKTFEDIENAAKTISEKTNKEIAGITMRGQQGIQGVYVWAAYLWGFGGSFLDADGKSALATPEGTAALDAFTKVLNAYGPVGVANFGWEENRLLFQQGKAAITLDATVNGAYNEDPAESSVVGKVGYAPVPMKSTSPKGGSSSLAVHSLFVAADSQNQEAATLFAAWATAKEQQLKSMESDPNSGVTSLTALNGEAFGKRYGAFKEAMITAINQGNPQYLPTIEQANEVINNTGIAVSKALAGTASARGCAEGGGRGQQRGNRALRRPTEPCRACTSLGRGRDHFIDGSGVVAKRIDPSRIFYQPIVTAAERRVAGAHHLCRLAVAARPVADARRARHLRRHRQLHPLLQRSARPVGALAHRALHRDGDVDRDRARTWRSSCSSTGISR